MSWNFVRFHARDAENFSFLYGQTKKYELSQVSEYVRIVLLGSNRWSYHVLTFCHPKLIGKLNICAKFFRYLKSWPRSLRHWYQLIRDSIQGHLHQEGLKNEFMKIIIFSNFSCMFLNHNIFFPSSNSNCFNLLDIRNKLKKHSVIKNCSK